MEIVEIESTTRDGKQGFDMVVELTGASERVTKTRARANLTASFPIKAVDVQFIRTERSVEPSLMDDSDRTRPFYQHRYFIPLTGTVEEFTVEKFKEILGDIMDG